MKKFTLAFAVALLSVFVFSNIAFAASTDDPNHAGYTKELESLSFANHVPVKWVDVKTTCKKCEPLVESYNLAMQELMNSRMNLKNLELMDKSLKNSKPGEWDPLFGKKSKDLSGGGEELAAGLLDAREGMIEMVKDLDKMRKLVKNLEHTTKDIRHQIKTCENQCTPEKGDENIIGSYGTPLSSTEVSLPFDWKGPYAPMCKECEKLTQRLNDLPGLALKNLAELDAATAREQNIKTYIHTLKTQSRFTYGLDNIGKMVREKESELKKTQSDIKRLQKNYEEINKNFKETLALHEKCNKNCKPPVVPKSAKSACAFPQNGEVENPILIGPNSEFGTSAAVKDKIKSKAKGAAMGALGKMMGGSGISFGGGGSPMGGGSDDGPKTDKDPTTGGFTFGEFGGVEIGFRADYTGDDELTVSSKIKDAPGDGTFHAQWIEDGQGNVYRPVRYLIFTLYRDWKLTVWWTYDRYVDGEHVEHDEGEEVSFGRDYLGDFMVRLKDIEESIWRRLGFETAVKGVQGLGTVYNIPQTALAGGCPLRMVTHVTLPKEDPVMTQPTHTYFYIPGTETEIKVPYKGALRTEFDDYEE